MNNKVVEQRSISSSLKTNLLISITNCIDNSRDLKEFITDIRSILQSSGLPVFNISFMDVEKGQEYFLINADIGRLDINNTIYSGSDMSEVNLVRKVLLSLETEKDNSVILPVMNGLAAKSHGIVFGDDNFQTCNFETGYFFEYYASLSPLLGKIYDEEFYQSIRDSFSGGIVIFPVKCGSKVVGTIDMLLRDSEVHLSAEDLKRISLISGILAGSYNNFINMYRASSSEAKYRAIFESTPLAIVVVDREYQIMEANNRFKAWYPKYIDSSDIVFEEMSNDLDNPFSAHFIRETFDAGRGVMNELESSRDGKKVYYRIKTSPLFSENGDIYAVMEIIEDITSRAVEDIRIKKENRKLEFEVAQKIEALKEKEKNLTTLVETVKGIENAATVKGSFEEIIQGYVKLDAAGVAFALRKNEEIRFEKVYPDDKGREFEKIFGISFIDEGIVFSDNPENPFVSSADMVNPIFYIGEDGLEDFFKSCFPESDKKNVKKAIKLVGDHSIVVFPLETKQGAEGSIAVAADTESLQDNFEYFQLLSNTAAVEISRHRNSDNLARSELKYRNLVETSRDMITLCDVEGNIQFSNSSFYEKTGIGENELVNYKIFDLFTNGSRTKLQEIINSCFDKSADPEPAELLMKSPSAGDIWTELTINNISNSKPSFQLVFRDITSRKNMEFEIGNLTAFQEKILQNDFIGIVTMTPEGFITNWNRGASNLMGYGEKEVIQKNISELVVSEHSDNPSDYLPRDLDVKHQTGKEVRFRKKDGSLIYVMYIESIMRDSRNNPSVIIAFFFDVTDRVKLEAESKELMLQLTEAQNITILSLAKLTEYRDIETGSHLERIMHYTGLLTNELATFRQYKNYISAEYISDLINSCPLHDIGKVGIPDQILHKPGKLTKEEFEIMKNHTIIGGDTIQEAESKLQGRSYLNLGKEVAYYHHERWDGTGYPRGLREEEIPLSARIVAVADVYDALTSRRPYKDAFSHETASEIITTSSGSHFDDSIVKAFRNCEDDFRKLSLQ